MPLPPQALFRIQRNDATEKPEASNSMCPYAFTDLTESNEDDEFGARVGSTPPDGQARHAPTTKQTLGLVATTRTGEETLARAGLLSTLPRAQVERAARLRHGAQPSYRHSGRADAPGSIID
jgi:hypothetical protein